MYVCPENGDFKNDGIWLKWGYLGVFFHFSKFLTYWAWGRVLKKTEQVNQIQQIAQFGEKVRCSFDYILYGVTFL